MAGNPYNCKENLTKKTLNISIGVFLYKNIPIWDIFAKHNMYITTNDRKEMTKNNAEKWRIWAILNTNYSNNQP